MRRIFVIRHAEAEEPVEAARAQRNDRERRLTESGKRDMRKGAQGLTTLVDDIQLILTSPLKRALETAEILQRAFPGAKLKQHALLAPGFDPAELLESLTGESGAVALVGHEPDLSQWVGYMTTGMSRSVVRMKKGSVCRLDMPEPALPGEACIAWLLTLKQLARLAP
ncbi:MAG TPA: phosphohistidine phosphatase SixA [Gammaproteobacteria bacterium]|jgi:phosphohistidine phosphatase|nr:phosphohistidine phosphatase SixA [Gammaproteobacteria bacterium]